MTDARSLPGSHRQALDGAKEPVAFHVVWHVPPRVDLIQMSGILSGISALAGRGRISVTVDRTDDAMGSAAVMQLTITRRASSTARRLVIDLHDREDLVFPSALQWCDQYFKRQCGPATTKAAGLDAHRIRPLGLTVAGFSAEAYGLVVAAIWVTVRARRSGAASRMSQALDYARLWLGLPPPRSALARPTDVKHHGIVFQPRLWDTLPGSDDVFDLANVDRMETVRELRAAFPKMATVGLTRTEAARKFAPDLLLGDKVTTGRYHRQLRTMAVAVNCVGLAGSVGWKLAEYLAAGCAIVSQPLTKHLPVPLVEGVHYLPYRTPKECVQQCRHLLDNPTLAAEMGALNQEYFVKYVDPPALVERILGSTFD